MKNTRKNLEQEFLDILSAYFDDNREAALHRAYELGRQSISSNVGLLELAELEKRALRETIQARDGQAVAARIEAVLELLSESFAPFEMTHRSFREANQSLKRVNAELAESNEALRRAHDLVRTVVDTLGAGIVTADGAGNVLLSNQSAVELLGGDPALVPLHLWSEQFGIYLQDGRTPLPVESHPLLCAERGEETGQLELQIRGRDGSHEPRWIWASARGLGAIGSSSRLSVLLLTDVTRHKTMERQMLQTERARVLALMAGSLVHDVKNILAVVALEAEALQDPTLPPDEARSSGERLHKVAQRGAGMLQRLLTLGQSGTSQTGDIEPAMLLEETVDMVKRILPAGIQIELAIAKDVGTFTASWSEIEQCLTNLVINARDAMSDGGRITLEARAIQRPVSSPLSRKDWVEIAVRDTGCGMDESVRANLFEPFFSTKGQGKGTGLGLVSVLALVTRNGGEMDVESAPGRGSRFAMRFPACHRS